MASDATFTVHFVPAIEPELMLDLNSRGCLWAVVRTSPTRRSVWSFHTTESAAKAAARRWASREIVTR